MIGPQDRAAWTGKTIDFHADGLHTLSAAEVEEIDAALSCLREQGELDFPAITPETFPLPTLGAFLRGLRDELRFGRGFVLLRGIPRERYSTDDMARIYFGLGCHIGAPLPQSWQGELLGHVIDVSDIEPGARGYHTGGAQRFHTDSCDVVSLMCLQSARSGGASRICSSIAVHRRLERERPDLLQALYDGFIFRRREVDAEHGSGVLVRRISVFARTGEEISVFLSGDYPNRAVAAGDAVMTPIQREALDAVQRIAASPDTYLDMRIGEGDIQFLNNRLLLHGRTGYEDHREMARRRHLLRLWLGSPSGRRSPRVRRCTPAKTTRFGCVSARRSWKSRRATWPRSPRGRPNWRSDLRYRETMSWQSSCSSYKCHRKSCRA